MVIYTMKNGQLIELPSFNYIGPDNEPLNWCIRSYTYTDGTIEDYPLCGTCPPNKKLKCQFSYPKETKPMTPHIPNPTTGAVPTPVTPAQRKENNSPKATPKIAKIHAKKILVRGEPHFEITGFENILKQDELPYSYTRTKPSFFLYDNDEFLGTVSREGSRIYKVREQLTEHEFQTLISTLKEAGERLTRIHHENKQRAKKFDGSVITIEI